MKLTARPSRLRGAAAMPGSKSHTIRAVAIAALADGTSRIHRPLDSLDAQSAVRAYRALGATIDASDPACWTVEGIAGKPRVPDDVIDVGNSGTLLRIAIGSAALLPAGAGEVTFTGDHQIQRRPVGPLLEALEDLGARGTSLRGNGCVPAVIRGRIRGGSTAIDATNSQYLSALLLNCPLADGESEVRVTKLGERPYVEMTLDWLDRQDIRYVNHDFRRFVIPGGQAYRPLDRAVPADWSSATFFLVAGAICDAAVTLTGLDINDTQGDRAVVEYLRAMGARVETAADTVTIRRGNLKGIEIDMNATPDALPALAVAACFAEGTTRLVNVEEARRKETDRIQVMAAELGKLGGRLEELPDGLVIHGQPLHGGEVEGHDDHRIVMALSLAGLAGAGDVTIHSAEAVAVTFPTFVDLMAALGADMATA
ncbi:MAG: 3-phosphoshikimate 1-carboxyvinyltransferase [Phycisphaerae bacterium]|nr:3-phosphoshikimate 1-carboxyvinyltransferase [Phycisphaerae bacterium]